MELRCFSTLRRRWVISDHNCVSVWSTASRGERLTWTLCLKYRRLDCGRPRSFHFEDGLLCAFLQCAHAHCGTTVRNLQWALCWIMWNSSLMVYWTLDSFCYLPLPVYLFSRRWNIVQVLWSAWHDHHHRRRQRRPGGAHHHDDDDDDDNNSGNWKCGIRKAGNLLSSLIFNGIRWGSPLQLSMDSTCDFISTTLCRRKR